MEFRPLDEKLIQHCAKTDRCSQCNVRIGCPIRHNFYTHADTFEISLQTAEMLIARYVGEEHAFNASRQIRNKKIDETTINPYFSYL